jgi:hypothetical protein
MESALRVAGFCWLAIFVLWAILGFAVKQTVRGRMRGPGSPSGA